MAAGTIIDIANRALGSISARAQIQSLNEGSTESNAVNTFYQSTFEALARTARWNCLKKQASLTLVAAAPGTPENINGTTLPFPPNPWYYSYLVPSDSLSIRRLVPPPVMTQVGGVPIATVINYVPYQPWGRKNVPFEVAYGQDTLGNPAAVINTNLSQAQAIYTVNQSNPSFWDSLFQQAMVASLGVFLCPSVSGDKAQANISMQSAERLIAQARAADGNEGTVSQDHTPDWIAARSGESGPWALGMNGPNVNWENMPWPVI